MKHHPSSSKGIQSLRQQSNIAGETEAEKCFLGFIGKPRKKIELILSENLSADFYAGNPVIRDTVKFAL